MCSPNSNEEEQVLSGSEVIKIETDAEGLVVDRPNRFLCIVNVTKPESREGEMVHVHDPGRLEDILYPGNRVLLKRAKGDKRKTRWDLIAADVRGEWVLVNSAWHRRISEWIIDNKVIPFLKNVDIVLPEQKYGDSRLDFLLKEKDRSIWVEVKGCTFAHDGIALFPDAPTTRGKRHLEELIRARNEGHEAAIFILIFRQDAEYFAPNDRIDPDFASTFRKAMESGVKVFPFKFSFKGNTIFFHSILPVFARI